MSPQPIWSIADNMNSKPVGKKSPSPRDVILGRGGHSNHHLGNAVFRSVVTRAKQVYHAAPKTQKIVVARSIVEAVYSNGDPPGRFLQKNKTDGLWYEVPFEKAVEKTKQALREKAWKTEEAEEENEEVAEKMGMAMLDLPALQAQVTSCGPKALARASLKPVVATQMESKKRGLAESDVKPASLSSAHAVTNVAPTNTMCTKPQTPPPDMFLPPLSFQPGASATTNTALKMTKEASKKSGGGNDVAFSKLFRKIGPIPTTLTHLTTAVIEGSAEKPPPEKKRRLLQRIEEGCHKRTMEMFRQKTPERGAFLAAAAPAHLKPEAMGQPPALAPKDDTSDVASGKLNALLARPGLLQNASKSAPAYACGGSGNASHSVGMYGSNAEIPILPINTAVGNIAPLPAPNTASIERVPSFVNPIEGEGNGGNISQQPSTPEWQKAWKSGGTPPSSTGTSLTGAATSSTPSPPPSPLRSDTTRIFASLFFGLSSAQLPQSLDEGKGSGDDEDGIPPSKEGKSSMLTSLICKASESLTTALSRGFSRSPTQALAGGISLGRGLTAAMSFGGGGTGDDPLGCAGSADSFDWDGGDKRGRGQGEQRDQPQDVRAECRMSLIDDDDEDERPDLARLRSLETRPASLAHRSKSAPYRSLHR